MIPIDITDSAFSLDVLGSNPVLTSVTEGGLPNNYMIYIYIGIAALILLSGFYIFKTYQNKNILQSNDNSSYCPGGFCMLNQNPIEKPNQNINENI